MLYEKTLYIRHTNGKIGSWAIKVEAIGDVAKTTVTATKVLGGKATETITEHTEGKNIGRANETTPREQAVFEAESKVNKKIDKGYTETLPAEGEKATNAQGLPKPMLAKATDDKTVIPFPVHVQPKLDGHRCLALKRDGQVVMYSRQGKPINLPHIAEFLRTLLAENEHIDGELYCHGKTLQEISSLVKKPRPESTSLRLVAYDLIQDACYSVRHGNLAAKFLPTTVDAPVVLLGTRIVDNELELNQLHSANLADGYEGTMIRTHGVPYEDGKRSSSLLKKKDFQDAEFKVVDIVQGKPRHTDNGVLQVGIYVCETDAGKRFQVTAEGDMHRKNEVWEQRAELLGKMLTVKFFNWTPDRVPFLPVALRIRDDL